jgi:TolB protein
MGMERFMLLLGILGCGTVTLFGQTSSDAAKLLCVSNRTGNAEIFLIDADGKNSVNLTKSGAENTFPTWSPDGKKIAFTSDRDGHLQLYVMDADGSNVKRLTDNPSSDRAPAWSPDGKQIAFCRNQEVYVMNADGSDPKNLTDNPSFNADPSWAPDGKRIAFTSNRSGQGFHLYVMDADGKAPQQFSEANNPFGYVFPAWSPDGKTIGYTDIATNALEIFARDVAAGKRTQLTKLGGLNTQLSWSPTSKQVAFLHADLGDITNKVTSLYVMAADGSSLKEILKREVPLEGGRPSWKPK